jgi:hypothetical protein
MYKKTDQDATHTKGVFEPEIVLFIVSGNMRYHADDFVGPYFSKRMQGRIAPHPEKPAFPGDLFHPNNSVDNQLVAIEKRDNPAGKQPA